MRTKLFGLLLLFLSSVGLSAQPTPSEIKYKIWDMHALRHYPFRAMADSIMERVYAAMEVYPPGENVSFTKQTDLGFVIDKPHLNSLLQHSSRSNDLLSKYVIRPYSPWMEYAKPIKEGGKELSLTLLASEEDQSGAVSEAGIFDFPGQYTTSRFVDDLVGEMDIFRDRNEVVFTYLSGPLGEKTRKDYVFYLSSEEMVNGVPCYEVVFMSRKKKEQATEGMLYINKVKHTVEKAVFTVNYSLDISIGRTILMEHIFRNNIPVEKKTRILIGSDEEGGLLISQQADLYRQTESPLEKPPSFPEADSLYNRSKNTRAWRNVQSTAALFLTDHFGLGVKPKVELGALSHLVSYNQTEGLRFRLGGRTTTYLNPYLGVGGYVAYGLKDEEFKWRGDLVLSLKPTEDSFHEFPKSLLIFSYVDDLNIPGQDLLESRRDQFFRSFSHKSQGNLSHLKVGKLSYEHEFENHFSFIFDGKRTEDCPAGTVSYDPYTTTEAGFSIRYAPNEKSIRVRNKSLSLRQGDIEVKLNHRIGLKDVLGSDYSYHISEASVFKQIYFPQGIGKAGLQVLAGKVWSQVPFPLLFIPRGNHSYIYSANDYNLMEFYEFATDNYLSGKVDLQFNWSPLDLFTSGLNIRSHIGGKVLYGPLSDKNDPGLHPELPAFGNGVRPLGDTPYAEVNIGFSGILRILRIDYVRRLTYTDNSNTLKGAILVGASISF